MSAPARRATRPRRSAVTLPQERIEPTPERLARARDSGQDIAQDRERRVRVDDPFDLMRAHRALAPQDPRLNDLRWLIGEALRRLHHRASLDALRAMSPDRVALAGYGPRAGLPQSEIALAARDKLRACESLAGAAVWPVLRRIVIEGAQLRDCRALIAEVSTPWRADAILADRLRCGSTRLAPFSA